jgi:hypothetical protein
VRRGDGINALSREAMKKRAERNNVVPLPWVHFPHDVSTLSGIMITIDGLEAVPEEERRFFLGLRDFCEAMAMRLDRGQALVG